MNTLPAVPAIAGAVLDNLETAVLVVDAQRRLAYLNPAAEQLLSVSGRRLRGAPLSELLVLDEALRNGLDTARDTAAPYTSRELPLTLAAGGRRLLVDYTASPLHLDGALAAVVMEITAMDRHQRSAREEMRLAQLDVTRTLARGFAHEVKNPLGGLRGAAQLLQRELHDPALHEYTDIIIREADRLHNLLDRMLGPNSRPRLAAINVHEVTEHVRKLVQANMPSGVTIATDYDPSIPPFLLDRDFLVQALLNLVRNALEAVGERGCIELRTRILRQQTIGATVHRLATLVQVIDDGPGIAEELRDKIFFPMVTGRAEGTGLGLSIAQSLLGQLGGLIECSSSAHGTVFDVLLPMETA